MSGNMGEQRLQPRPYLKLWALAWFFYGAQAGLMRALSSIT